MNKKYILLLFAFCCNLSLMQAQSLENKADSLLNLVKMTKQDTVKTRLYEELSRLYANTDFEVSRRYAKKSLKFAQKANFDLGIFNAYIRLFYEDLLEGGKTEQLKRYADLLEKYAKKIGDPKLMTKVYFNHALYYSNLQMVEKELDFYFKALKNIEKYGGSNTIKASLLSNIANILLDNSRADALVYYHQAFALAEDFVNKGNIARNIALSYFEEGNKMDSTLLFINIAETLFKKGNDISGLVGIKGDRMLYEQQKGNIERAEFFLKEAIALAEKNNLDLLLTYNQASIFYFNIKKYDKAIRYGELSLQIAKEQEHYYGIEDIYLTLHYACAKAKDYENAYNYLTELYAFEDSTNNLALRSKVETLTTEFEVKQKETENKLLKAEKAASEKTLRSRNATLLAMFFGLIFLGGWAFFIYRANQQKKKYNEILEQKVAERTAELENANKNLEQANYELRTFNYIASHDIKEPIRNVGNYAGLIFRKLPQDLKTDLQDYFDIIKRSTVQLYTLVEDFARYTTLSKNDKIELRKIDLNDLIGSITTDLTEVIKKYHGQVLLSSLPIIESNNSLLYPALKNLIENGLKYNQSETPTVQISHSETETHHEIHIKDNGIGIEPQYHAQIFEMFKRLHDRSKYEGSGIGLAITKLTVKKLGGDIKLKSNLGEGSTFVICLPLWS